MIDQYPPANGVLTSLIWRKTAAGGETSLSGYDNASQALSYTPGQEQVYLNGILLVRGDDYTATNGTSITGLAALSASDFVQINCYNNFSVASLPSTSITGTIANNQLANSAITINGNAVSLGGSVSIPGDIESVSAGTGLTGGGSSGAVTLSLSTPVSVANGGTGITSFGSGVATWLGTPSSSNLAAAVTDETGSGALVFGTSPTITTPIITLGTSTPSFSANAYTLASGDQYKFLLASNSSTAGTVNIPTNATVAFPTGTQITIIQTGSGQLTITAATPATTTVLSTGATAASPKLRVQYSSATLIKVATDTWYVVGDIS